MKRIVCAAVLLIALAVVNTGCALLGPAIGAGVAYGIYMATQK